MKRCKQCNAEYDNRDNCPNCGSTEFWEIDVWGQPQEPQTPPVNLTKEQPQSPPPPPPYQPPTSEPQPNYGQQQNYNQQQNYGQPQPQYGQPPVVQDNSAKGMAVAALVLGILSIILCFAPFVGLGMGIVALCLGVSAKKRLPAGEQGMATAGVVLGIIGIIIGAIVSIVWGIAFAACTTALWSYSDPYYWYW